MPVIHVRFVLVFDAVPHPHPLPYAFDAVLSVRLASILELQLVFTR